MSKAKTSWLRIYGLRVESNIYIITGGAIKLKGKMIDRKHTNDQFKRLKSCRNYLIDHDIIDLESIMEYIENKK